MKRLLVGLACLLLASGLAACHHSEDDATASTPTIQLKLYHVPAQQSQQLVRALNSALAGNTLSNAIKGSVRVTSPFPGTLTVLAPADMQHSIRKVIETLGKHPGTGAAPAQFEVHFWLVDMLPGAGTDTSTLKPLSGTLDALRQRMGPAHFVLTDDARAVSQSGHKAHNLDTASRHRFQFWIPSTEGNQAQLVLRYVDRTGEGFSLKTTAYMTLGQYMVLAQVAAPGTLPDHHPAPPPGSMRLLVVRVDKLTAHAD